MYHICFIHLSISEYLDCFLVLAIVNHAAINIGVHVPFQITVFSGYAQAWDCWIIWHLNVCFFLRNLHNVLRSTNTNLYSYQQYMRVPFFLHPLQLLLLADFLMIPILTDVRWHFIVVFICISLIVSNVEHLFMCLFVIYITSLEKSLLFILLSWIVCFFDTELKELFIYFGILTLYQLYHLQILSSI